MLDPLDFTLAHYGAMAAIALLGGLVRGFSGFGAALIITPVVSVIVGPRVAVPAVTLALMITTVQLLVPTWSDVRWRHQWILSVAGCSGVVLGALVLVTIDQEFLRRAISALTAASAVFLMTGWRYSGSTAGPAAAVAGFLGGIISGAGSIGGPPVIAYLLAGQGTPAQIRAGIIYYFAATQVFSLTTYGLVGLMGTETLVVAAIATPTLLLGTWIGSRLFRRATEKIFRWIALTILLCVGVATLLI